MCCYRLVVQIVDWYMFIWDVFDEKVMGIFILYEYEYEYSYEYLHNNIFSALWYHELWKIWYWFFNMLKNLFWYNEIFIQLKNQWITSKNVLKIRLYLSFLNSSRAIYFQLLEKYGRFSRNASLFSSAQLRALYEKKLFFFSFDPKTRPRLKRKLNSRRLYSIKCSITLFSGGWARTKEIMTVLTYQIIIIAQSKRAILRNIRIKHIFIRIWKIAYNHHTMMKASKFAYRASKTRYFFRTR